MLREEMLISCCFLAAIKVAQPWELAEDGDSDV